MAKSKHIKITSASDPSTPSESKVTNETPDQRLTETKPDITVSPMGSKHTNPTKSTQREIDPMTTVLNAKTTIGFSTSKSPVLREIKEWSKSILWGAIFVYFFTGYVFKAYRVEGTSMQPLLQNGQRIFVNRLIYNVDDIKRGDVVVFYYPSEPHEYFIKRVIGMPGETIEFKNGKAYVDNKLVDDHFVPQEFWQNDNIKPLIIPKSHYFVCGDHRNKSADSRYWTKFKDYTNFVPEKYIIGKASFRYWPLTQFGLINSNFIPLSDNK